MLARKRFTKIHKLVLGLASGDLQRELEIHRSSINVADSGGFTALGWSAARGDLATLEALLLHNAKIYVPGVAQSDALNCAMASRTPSCIKPLLRAGADANARSEFGETALHIAAMRHDDPENYMAPLLEYRAKVDAQDNMGFTALCYAVQFGRVESIRYLATQGADLNISNNAGLNALGLALTENAHEIIHDLMVLGANTSCVFHLGQSILHLAAQHGNQETVTILEKGELTVDPNIQDKKGNTCMDILRLRREAELATTRATGTAAPMDTPTEDAFRLLCSSIEHRRNNPTTTSPSDSTSGARMLQSIHTAQRIVLWLLSSLLDFIKSCLTSAISKVFLRACRRDWKLLQYALVLLIVFAASQHLYRASPSLSVLRLDLHVQLLQAIPGFNSAGTLR